MTVLLTLTFVAFLLAAVGGITLAAVAIAVWACEESAWLLDERRGSRMLDDADVARRDALSLSVLAAEWQPMFDEPDGFVCLFLPDEEGWR